MERHPQAITARHQRQTVGLHREVITERHLRTAEPTREAKLEVTVVPIQGNITQQNETLRILTLPLDPNRPL